MRTLSPPRQSHACPRIAVVLGAGNRGEVLRGSRKLLQNPANNNDPNDDDVFVYQYNLEGADDEGLRPDDDDDGDFDDVFGNVDDDHYFADDDLEVIKDDDDGYDDDNDIVSFPPNSVGTIKGYYRFGNDRPAYVESSSTAAKVVMSAAAMCVVAAVVAL